MCTSRALLALLCSVLSSLTLRAEARCTNPGEPPLAELSARALRTASLQPGRVSALLRRARVAALLPRVQVRLGQGTYDYVHNPDSLDPSVVSTDTWRFDVTATFELERLVFSPYEVRIAEAAGRLTEHRARLLDHIAATWAARRALDDPSAPTDTGAMDRCEQLTVLLATLTGATDAFSLRREAARP